MAATGSLLVLLAALCALGTSAQPALRADAPQVVAERADKAKLLFSAIFGTTLKPVSGHAQTAVLPRFAATLSAPSGAGLLTAAPPAPPGSVAFVRTLAPRAPPAA